MAVINFAKVERGASLSEMGRGVRVKLVCVAAAFGLLSLNHFCGFVFQHSKTYHVVYPAWSV